MAHLKFESIKMIDVLEDSDKVAIMKNILGELRGWFTDKAINEEYPKEIVNYIVYNILDGKKSIGMIAVKFNNLDTAEIYVMGIIPEYHSKGIGQELIRRL